MRPFRRRAVLPRRLRLALAAGCAVAALATLTAGGSSSGQTPAGPGPADERDPGGIRYGDPGVQVRGVARARLRRQGERLFDVSCASCHGTNARGIPGRAPSLRGVGELSADFYLRTGRMPLPDPEEQPRRTESPFTERQIDALIAYVGSFGGPPVPEVDPGRGDLAEGLRLFGESCMGCHQVVGQGGVATRVWIPDLQKSEPIDVAEAVHIGPYLMPHFRGQFTQRQIDSLARYIEYTEDPEDRGGWGIGHIGPLPEGMVTWLLAAAALVLTIRLIGERTTDDI